MSAVSVLVPSYNHAPFVERTLRSIFAQTLKPEKLIVIDDGSKDESAAIIRRVLRDCPFGNEFIERENRGLSATLNEGFARAEGEFFAYLGSDDLWFPNFLEERIGLLESRPRAVLAFGHAFLIDENERIIDSTAEWTSFADGDVLPFLLRGQIFSSPSVVYRRHALEKYKWNENSVLEDYELYLKLCAEGEFARDERILCAWRQHGWNVSGNFPLMLSEWLAAQDRAAQHLNLSRAELDVIQTELKFQSIADYVRHGHRREAINLFFDNLSGARSAAQIGKMLFRLAVPQTLFQWNRNRKRRRAIEKYGKLDLEKK
ncbi:MAG: glycosyltransferase family 2 protein [Acidobacteriota bacterium]|nr:glycosyltransferase family 2 protein [Acidobacteriota bacterium]